MIRQDQSTGYAATYLPDTPEMIIPPLQEPLLFAQIERFKARNNVSAIKSYVLVPSMTKIEASNLEASNMLYVQGTLEDFTNWLGNEFPSPPTPNDLLMKSRPELDVSGVADLDSYHRIFNNVIPISRSSLSLSSIKSKNKTVREFYKGSKPSWEEILDEVPAFLTKTQGLLDKLVQLHNDDRPNLICLFGNAGCGKTTILKQAALHLSEKSNDPVYYIDGIDNDIRGLITALEDRNEGRYFVFIDRLGDVSNDLAIAIKNGGIKNGIFIGAENKGIWNARFKDHLGEHCTISEDISHINEADAEAILDKIKVHGSWTRLGKLSHANRVKELVSKSSKQLLIGLIETISGEGYNKIIQRDFNNLPSSDHENLLILVGLATAQRTWAHESTITRALTLLNSSANIRKLISEMDGILSYTNGKITARHRVYIEKLFELCITPKRMAKIIEAYIDAFTVYETPIIKNINPAEGAIYRYIVNAKNLKKRLNNDQSLIVSIYNRFEKELENEGLFLLQYGLALRSFGRHEEAYEKLRVAHDAFHDSPQIEHALALQRIIMAIRSDAEPLALAYFKLAQDTLERLDSAGINVFDAYPIITLSEGHVRLYHKLYNTMTAKILANEYFDKISRRHDFKNNTRLKETAEKLKRYSLTGILVHGDELDTLI